MSTLAKRFTALSQKLDELSGRPEEMLTELSKQREELRFESFDLSTAWEIGCKIREIGLEEKLPVAAEIRLGAQVAFHVGLPGAAACNDAWARRKGAVVEQYLDSSLAVGVSYDQDWEGGFDAMSKLSANDYAAHGGAFPLLLTTGVALGYTAASGLPSIHDHALVVTAIAAVLGKF
ncbi:MAG: heme-binding protein [Propionibacteriaceae bacterium]|jgi:uncharacterized protein (UPF0303 family)|nr:heme-binding protein [Propionibacteriaceae bacterium]